MGVCNCSMFCCTLLYVHSSIAIILMGKRELIALLNLSSWCLVMVERLFLAVPQGCLQFVIVVFPDHTHLLFSMGQLSINDTLSVSQCSLAVWGLFGEIIGNIHFPLEIHLQTSYGIILNVFLDNHIVLASLLQLVLARSTPVYYDHKLYHQLLVNKCPFNKALFQNSCTLNQLSL